MTLLHGLCLPSGPCFIYLLILISILITNRNTYSNAGTVVLTQSSLASFSASAVGLNITFIIVITIAIMFVITIVIMIVTTIVIMAVITIVIMF